MFQNVFRGKICFIFLNSKQAGKNLFVLWLVNGYYYLTKYKVNVKCFGNFINMLIKLGSR